MDNKYLIPLALFIGTVVLFGLTLRGPVEAERAEKKKGISYQELQRIQNDSVREIQMQYDRTQLENAVRPHINPNGTANEHVPNVVEVTGPHGEMDRSMGSVHHGKTLDEKLEAFLAERQLFEEMKSQKKREYVKLFLKQARELGYDVKINNQMEIVDVRKIKK